MPKLYTITITTQYVRVSKEFVDYYCDRMKRAPVLPGCQSIVPKLKKTGYAEIKSPTGDKELKSFARTSYEIRKYETEVDGSLA